MLSVVWVVMFLVVVWVMELGLSSVFVLFFDLLMLFVLVVRV